MARAKVTHSDDAVQITFNGNKNSPEPSTAVIKFPGGHVEVSRCSDGSYWAHLQVVDNVNIADSRIDYFYGASDSVQDLPESNLVKKIAIRVSGTVVESHDS